MSILLYLGIMLLAGLLFGRLVKFISLPNVTGYLIAGLLMGPYVFNILSFETVEHISVVSEMALAFIAFSIGSEFSVSYLKEMGIIPIVIAFFGAILTAVFVALGLIIYGLDPALAVMLGTIASATAPAATVMVIKQYQANGPVTKTLLSVVAIDDAIALIAFGFALTFINSSNEAGGSVLLSLLSPFIELTLSAALGLVLALLLLIPLHFFKKESNRMCAIIGILFITSSLADYLGASALLACMFLGAVLVNIEKEANSIFKIADSITPPVFMLFFVLSGAELDVSIIPSIGVIGVIYILMRIFGKVFGAWFGAVLTKSVSTVKKYVGWTLLPQAGVAIGLSLVVDKALPQYSSQVRAVVLCGVLVFELIGPIASKIALTKAGEIEYKS